MAFSPNGNNLAVFNLGKGLTIFDPKTGFHLAFLNDETLNTKVSYDERGERIAIFGDHTPRLFDAHKFTLLTEFNTPCEALSRDFAKTIYLFSDSAYLHNLTSGEATTVLLDKTQD